MFFSSSCPAETGIILNLQTQLESGVYTVVLRVADNLGLERNSTVQATVCDCTGEELDCTVRAPARAELPLILGVLAGLLLLLSKNSTDSKFAKEEKTKPTETFISRF